MRKMLSLDMNFKYRNMNNCQHVHLSVLFIYGSSIHFYYFIKVKNANLCYGLLIIMMITFSEFPVYCLFLQAEKDEEGRIYLQRYYSTHTLNHFL